MYFKYTSVVMLCWCCLYEVVLGSVAALSISVLPRTHARCWVAINENQPSLTSILITILQLNLCYQLPLGFILRCLFQKTALFGISDAGFCGPDVLPVSNHQCQSTEGHSKHWHQPHPFFIFHPIPEVRSFAPFILALQHWYEILDISTRYLQSPVKTLFTNCFNLGSKNNLR